MAVDFRACLYALSDVIINRPPPLRVFDQIYMKLPDMLLQAELIARWFSGKKALFIGDGDAIALSLTHLVNKKLLPAGPSHITVLDFDERVVNSIARFGRANDVSDLISGVLYNVADPLPEEFWQEYDAFYTNPPWGKSNNGESVLAFIERGVEGVRGTALGCIVIGDHREYPWTHSVQHRTQGLLLGKGFRVSEMLPEFHQYHLDDTPDLTSCSLLVSRIQPISVEYNSQALASERLRNFYGQENPLRYRYIRDLTNGGKNPSRDVEMEPFDGVK